MCTVKTDKAHDRLSQLLGLLFVLMVVAGLIVALNPDGSLHDFGLNLIAEFIGLGIAVFGAEQLIQKHKDEQYNPHRDYAHSLLQKTITESFLTLIPPGEKSRLQRAEFGKFHAGYYDVPGISTSLDIFYKQVFKNSAEEVKDFKSTVHLSMAPVNKLISQLESITHQFFTIFDPPLLEAFLHLKDNSSDLENMADKSGKDLETKVFLYSEIYLMVIKSIYKLQELLLVRASRCIPAEKFEQEFTELIEKLRE